MSKSNGIVCDGCGVVCKTMNGDYPHSITYITIGEFDRILGGRRKKYHLCETNCTPEWFKKNPEGREIDVDWAFDKDEGRIVGASWHEYYPYCDADHHESRRKDFPEYISRMALHVEERIYQED